MLHIVSAQATENWHVRLAFDDGVVGEVDVRRAVPFDGVFAVLNDPAVFRQLYVDATWGTLNWPGELDLAPEALWQLVTNRPITPVTASNPL